MKQLLVECSEPGLVVSLAEEFEYVLRHVDFERAMKLREQLSALAEELGADVDRMWRGFRLETPNQSGCRPLAFSSRETLDPEPMERLTAEASERGIGSFEVGQTLLLQQAGPPPETREQYVRDLAAGIRGSDLALGVFSWPVPLPDTMADHREKLVEEHVLPVLRRRARIPTLGRRWMTDSHEPLNSALEEANTRAEAVMAYQLSQLDPDHQDSVQRIRWTALAVRLGREVDRWYLPTESALPYIYQKAALAWLLWRSGPSLQSARSFVKERLQACVELAEGVYTPDGVNALRALVEDAQQPYWRGVNGLLEAVRGQGPSGPDTQDSDGQDEGEASPDDD